jgi:threonylcarbamoyladenosine tRNA methylthiotransferase MtaB
MSDTTFAVEFLGCKVSMVDAQEIRERLAADGHAEAPPADARVRVVNTCCVTGEAVAKSRKAVRRAARGADRVYVTGCAANLAGEAFAGMPENVTVIERRSEHTPATISADLGPLGCTGGEPAFARTRAYVKIQDGCSFACSYCVIPSVRGASRSRRAADVLREAARRSAQGHRELVLTGINLGCFKDREAGVDLAGLLEAVASLDGVGRVRLSSIEVNHLTDRLLRTVAADARIAPHLHVPMQAGDDGVLRAMRRHYSAATFLSKLARARELVEGLNLTSDVIVGHPSEDAAAFERTLDAVSEAGFSKVHVFPYSPRPGTVDGAADPVLPAEKRRRSAALRGLSDRQGERHRAGKLGRTEVVLVEGGDGRGFSGDYTPFRVSGAPPAGALVSAVGRGLSDGVVVATMCR